MPRAPSKKVTQAEKLFNDGMAMVEIAKKLGVSDGTVRSWKNRYGWETDSKKNKCNVAKKDDKKNATLQKKKRGGQPGNKNAKGASGNPTPIPNTKHGAYKAVFMDALDEEEQKLIKCIPEDEDLLLMEQIQLFSIRERRILKAINKYRDSKEPVALYGIIRTENKRSFKDEAEEELYNRLIEEQIQKKERLPGKAYDIQTTTDNKDNIIIRLEQELSSVQNKKTKAIEALSKIRMKRIEMESNSASSSTVDDWITAVLDAKGEDNE